MESVEITSTLVKRRIEKAKQLLREVLECETSEARQWRYEAAIAQLKSADREQARINKRHKVDYILENNHVNAHTLPSV